MTYKFLVLPDRIELSDLSLSSAAAKAPWLCILSSSADAMALAMDGAYG